MGTQAVARASRRAVLAAAGAGILVGATVSTAPPGPRRRILVTGDSITQGSAGDYTWRYRLWSKLGATAPGEVDFVGPYTSVFDRLGIDYESPWYAVPFPGNRHDALWGDTLEQEAPQVADRVRASGCDTVLTLLGSNDLVTTNDAATVLGRLRDYVTRVRSVEAVHRLVVGEVLTRHDSVTGGIARAPQTATVNAGVRALSRLDSPRRRVVVARTQAGWDPRRHTWDGTHPNPAGENHIAQRFSEALAGLGLGAAEPDIARPTRWAVPGPRPVASVADGRVGLRWDRAPTGSSRMIVQARLEGRDDSFLRPAIPPTPDGWRSETLPAGQWEFRLVPVKGTSVGVPGPVTTVRV